MSKTRVSKNALVISCAHLGLSERLLKVLKVYADYYKADVYHLGQLVTLDEKKMYEYRQGKVRTFDKIKKESEEQNWKDKYLDKYNQAQDDFKTLCSAQDERIYTLEKHFGSKLAFIINDEQYFPTEALENTKVLGHDLALSKHVCLESLSANGDRVSGSPITERSFNFFRKKGGSFVVPHPNPVIESFNKEGLNQAYQYFTTGGLAETKDPKRSSEYYKAFQTPAAMLIMVDSENGEFHPKRIRFDYFRDPKTHRDEPMILDDGLLFSANGMSELDADDKGASITDTHVKYDHKGVTKAFCHLIGIHQGSYLYHGGDVADWPSASRHLLDKPLHREGVRFIDDVNAYFGYLKTIGNFPFLKEKRVVDSNHDSVWNSNYIAKNPELKGMCDWDTLMLRAPDWIIMNPKAGEDKTAYFGDLAIRHGHKEKGARSGNKIFGKYLCGHWHRHVEFGDSASQGAGCGLGPSYLENGTTAWTNTITSLSKFKGVARFNIKIVLHTESKKTSRFAYRNKIIEVNF